MRLTEVKWEDYTPIPWGRTKLALIWVSGAIPTILLWLLASALVRFPEFDIPLAFVWCSLPGFVAYYFALSDSKLWRKEYHARNKIGYDVVVWPTLGELNFEVVSSDANSPENWFVRLPLISGRPGRTKWCNNMGHDPRAWRVMWNISPTEVHPSSSSVVLLVGSDGMMIHMHLSDLVRIVPEYLSRHGVTSVSALVDELLHDVASRDLRETQLLATLNSVRVELGEVRAKLTAAHAVMHNSMLALGSDTRKSKTGERVRRMLARVLYRQTPEENDMRSLYQLHMASGRPLPRSAPSDRN